MILICVNFSLWMEVYCNNFYLWSEVYCGVLQWRLRVTKILIRDIASYGMLSAIDGRSKPMYLVYGDEVFRWSGPPEYMSPTALMRVVHRNSFKNSLMDKIQKNMLVPLKPSKASKVCWGHWNWVRHLRTCWDTCHLATFWNVSTWGT